MPATGAGTLVFRRDRARSRTGLSGPFHVFSTCRPSVPEGFPLRLSQGSFPVPLLFNALLTSADGFLLEKREESARFLLDLCWVPAGTVLGAAASASKPGRRGGGFQGKPRRSFRWTRVIALLGGVSMMRGEEKGVQPWCRRQRGSVVG